MPKISIIVPVYNEADNILPLFYEIKKYCPEDFELIWVDDGSTDDTLGEIQQLSFHEERIKCISLSRNFGHENAMMAGLNYATGEYIITMDGDLHHPPALIPQMISALKEGNDIVFTRQKINGSNNWIKTNLNKVFFRIANFFSKTRIEENLTDYRAFHGKVLDSVLLFKEKDTFLRGIFSWIGYRSATIEFTTHERMHGSQKYLLPLSSMNEFNSIILFNPNLAKFIILIIALSLAVTLFNMALWPIASAGNNTASYLHSAFNLLVSIVQLFLTVMIYKLTNMSVYDGRKRPVYLVKEMINF